MNTVETGGGLGCSVACGFYRNTSFETIQTLKQTVRLTEALGRQRALSPMCPKHTALSAWASTTALPLQKLLLFPGKEPFLGNTQVLNKAALSELEIKEALKYSCQHHTE